MKHGNILKEIEEELRDWMRPFAHSVCIAKSFKNEGEQVDAQQQQQQTTDTVVDPFAGIDLENQPDDVKAALIKAKTEFANLQVTAKTKEAEAAAATDLAKKHQSRADRFHTQLKQHNLDPDGTQQTQVDPDDAEINALAKEYEKQMGLAPDLAKSYAKMQHIAYKRGKADILRTVGEAVGPHIQSIGNMSVDRLLNNAAQEEQYADALSNDLIAQGAREILNTIVANGGAVDKNVIHTSISMAVGEQAMKGNMPQHQQQQPQQTTTIRTRGLFDNPPMNRGDASRNNGAPVAKNEDTAKAVAQVTEHMRRGLPKKK